MWWLAYPYVITDHDTLSNGDISVVEEEELPLISFEDAELLDSGNKPHPPPPMKERNRLLRNRLTLLSSKGLFYGVGVLLFVAGCILLASLRHDDVTEMCMLDEVQTMNCSSVSTTSPSSSFVFTSSFPSPTSTPPNQFQTLASFASSSTLST